ncbi:MAG: hypothetical protein MJ247_00620 [Alphaproteobacteria bacterium]|nr:hypothetical protein [Alphaproteobacteria bacterium]
MKIQALRTVFEAVEWIRDTANAEKIHLSAVKLHSILYLMQGYYSAITNGEKFIPCVFLATHRGPIEPSSYYLYESAIVRFTDNYLLNTINKDSRVFMETIWQKFAFTSEDNLIDLISRHEPFMKALKNKTNNEINIQELGEFFANSQVKSSPMPEEYSPNGTRVLRNQAGLAIKVKKWVPTNK